MVLKVLERALACVKNGEAFVLVTVVDVTGSAPGKIGSKMVVLADGDITGTVGGGALEKWIIETSRGLIGKGRGAHTVDIDVADLGMTCGGKVALLVEPFEAGPSVWIFGGGHIAKALVPLLARTGHRVTVVDNREAFAVESRFPDASRIIHGQYSDTVGEVSPGSYVVIVTHGHTHDEEVLLAVASRKPPLPYIGMIGSVDKVLMAFEYLRAAGVEPGSNIYSPIGLELGGGGSPAEIALAIAAEINGVRNGKTGLPHCRDRIKKWGT